MGHRCCSKQKVKRGLWSPEEDEKLIKYIITHGHGCWSSVPKLAGLQRCGKSCRLRWINYLRPDLKRGSFTTDEEQIIIDVHRILGNRWAQIAKHLPGRTDNEVKNFWNSCIKKRLISQGLDPKTHNLIPSHHHRQTQRRHSIKNIPSDSPETRQQQPNSVFTMNSQMNCMEVVNGSFLTIPASTAAIPLPPHNSQPSISMSNSEYHNPCTVWTVKSSIESTPNISSSSSCSINPSAGFGFIDENCIWGTGSSAVEHFGEEQLQPQQVQELPQDRKICDDELQIDKTDEKEGGQDDLLDITMDDLEFVESTLMCGEICRDDLTSMDDLAWHF